jgi:hypothetical protein
MRFKHVLFALSMAVVLCLATPRTQAQVVGGFIGFRSPGVVGFGAPVVAPAPVVAGPIVPYAAGYPVVVPRPFYGPGLYAYGGGWGFGPRHYGPWRAYPGYRYGYRRW